MSTSAQNNVVKGMVVAGGLQHEDLPCSNASFPINQGDLCWWDNTAHLVKAVTSDADAAKLVGIAAGSTKVSSSLDSSVESSINTQFGIIAKLKTTAAETYNNGTLVYAGADAQTITTVAGISAIGVVRLPAKGAAVTGASGVSVPVLIYSRTLLSLHE